MLRQLPNGTAATTIDCAAFRSRHIREKPKRQWVRSPTRRGHVAAADSDRNLDRVAFTSWSRRADRTHECRGWPESGGPQ